MLYIARGGETPQRHAGSESSLSTFTFPSTTMTFIRPLINHRLCFSTLTFAGNKSTGGSKLVETTSIRPMNPILAAIATVTRVTKSAAMMRAKRRAVTTKITPLYSSTERERPQSQARVPRVPARDPMIPARDPRVVPIPSVRIRAHRSLRAGQSHPQVQMITGIMSKLQVRGPSIPLPMNHSAWRSMTTRIF